MKYLVAPDTSGRYKRRKGLKTGEEITVKLYENVVMYNAFMGLLGGNKANEGQRYTQNDRRDEPSQILPNRNSNHQLE